MHPQRAIHRQSLLDREGFWLKAAQSVHWHRPPSRAYGPPSSISSASSDFLDRDGKTWFPDGQLSTCFNALDRHVYPPPTPFSPPLTPSSVTPHLAQDAAGASRIAFHHVSPMSFQTNKYRAISYGEALEHVQTLAGVLQHCGVQKGDTVVLYMPMIPETALAMLACSRIGAVHSVVFGGFAPKELAKRIQDSGCKLVIAASCGLEPKGPLDYKPLVDEALRLSEHKPSAGLLFFRRDGIQGHSAPHVAPSASASPHGLPEWDMDQEMQWTRQGKQGRSKCWECVPCDSDHPAYTLYTSGTTGMPKGVVRPTGGNAVGLRYSVEHCFGLKKDDVMFTASDLGWVVGHSYILYAPLLLGASTVIFEGKPILPDAGILWRTIASLGVTHFFTAPTALRAVRGLDPNADLMRAAANSSTGAKQGAREGQGLKSLRTLFLAGERSEPTIVSAYQKLLDELAAPGAHVVDNYWSTESGSPITMLAQSSAFPPLPPMPGSAGLPTPGMDVRVVDDDGKECAPGEMGNLVLGYPLAPTALPNLWHNRAGLHKSYLSKFADGKGDWFDTGDSAVVDPENGYVTVLARSDDIIQVAAHRLGTGLIEQVVTSHPNVIECCVVGAPDKMKGQMPFALVVARSSSTAAKVQSSAHDAAAKAVLKDVNDHVRKEMGPIAQLGGLVITSKLPKTRSGKTLRRSVRAIVENASEGGKGWEGEVPVPPTVEDASVIPLVREAIFKHFGTLPLGQKAKL